MTETAKMADIILPATTFVEHDDIYQGGAQNHITLGPKIIEPLGESRSNHDVLCALAERLGAEHRGFNMTSLEMVDETLKASGWPDVETLREMKWQDAQVPYEEAHFLEGFGHPDGKFHFKADWSLVGANASGMPSLPDHWDVVEKATEKYPYRMVTAPARNFLNTSFTATSSSLKREKKPTVMIHSDDAARIGTEKDAVVRMGNSRGSLLIHVEIFDGLQPGTVVVEGIWPCKFFIEKIGINLLVGSDSAKPNGGVAFHDTAVWIKPE